MQEPTLEFAVGDTLWFVDFADTDERDVLDQRYIGVGYIFSGVVAAFIEMERTRREDGWDAMFRVAFVNSAEQTYFYVGRRESDNPRWFRTREEALAAVGEAQRNDLAEMTEQFKQAEKALKIMQDIADQPIIETNTAVALDYGFRLASLKEAIAARGMQHGDPDA